MVIFFHCISRILTKETIRYTSLRYLHSGPVETNFGNPWLKKSLHPKSVFFPHIHTSFALYFFLYPRDAWGHFPSAWGTTLRFSSVKSITMTLLSLFDWNHPFFSPTFMKRFHQHSWNVLFYTLKTWFLYHLSYFVAVNKSIVSLTLDPLKIIFSFLFASGLS